MDGKKKSPLGDFEGAFFYKSLVPVGISIIALYRHYVQPLSDYLQPLYSISCHLTLPSFSIKVVLTWQNPI